MIRAILETGSFAFVAYWLQANEWENGASCLHWMTCGGDANLRDLHNWELL